MACVVHSAYIDGDGNTMYLQWSGGSIVTRDQLKASFLLGESFLDLMFSFSMRFNGFKLMQVEVALFSALMLITPGTCLSYITQYTCYCVSVQDALCHIPVNLVQIYLNIKLFIVLSALCYQSINIKLKYAAILFKIVKV